jgi:hypothetical protein
MGAVYSTLLWDLVDVAEGSYTSETVPSGFRWVVVDVVAFNTTSTWAWVGGLYLSDSEGAPIWSPPNGFALPRTEYRWSGRQVVNTGDNLQANSYDDGWSLRVSGFSLTLP